MIAIWKFPIPVIIDEQDITMPAGAKILSCKVQNGVITLWARVYTHHQTETRRVYIVGTGNPMESVPVTAEFIDSVEYGFFIWHIFVDPPYETKRP